MWAINGRFFNPPRSAVDIGQGAVEIWDLVNKSGGWSHPIHIHMEEARIIAKFLDGTGPEDEVPMPPHEQGRKDVFALPPNSRVKVLIRFCDFLGN
jgi:FtsP/CotA-like multicopper oxidase with cupredoxin domain